MSSERFDVARGFIESLPHARELGLSLRSLGAGQAVMDLPYDPRLIGDPETGVLHGGAVSTLMDTCCGTAVMCHPTAPISTATLNLRVDYMRAASPGQTIRAKAECYHVTRSVAFVRAVAHDDDESRPVATVSAVFTIERAA